MGISQFPSSSGGAINNDFVVDLNDTANNVATLSREFSTGSYSITLSSGDTSFDVYLLNSAGESVGYSNEASIVATGPFITVVILGVASSEVATFAFTGSVSNATAEGTAVGAGAYLTSVSPTDLPDIDDTANLVGGNFATDVEVYFESGETSSAAKNIVRSSSTALIVTRPDAFDPALDPWSLRAVNPGITQPTGSNANILTDAVDAGALPVWVTTSPLPSGVANTAYSETLSATDADGAITYAVTAGTLAAGLTLDSATGVLAGTPTEGQAPFTVTATDAGGNSNSREFALPIQLATGGTISYVGNYTVHTFESSGDFEALAAIPSAEYIILAGGGGGNTIGSDNAGGGGGGLLASIPGYSSGGGTAALTAASISVGTVAITVGAGGSLGSSGSASVITGVGTASGGGRAGTSGGSGGGGNAIGSGSPAGTVGQGFAGGPSNQNARDGSGGGTAGVGGGSGSPGGLGTHNFLDERGWGAGGGGGGELTGATGGGSTGNDQANYAGNGSGGAYPNYYAGTPPTANFGGGGGGSGATGNAANGYNGSAGASGKVIVRY
jgi:hypothetical protein